MRNVDQWIPTKYELRKGKLRGSRNPDFLTPSSRLMTDITAAFYQKYLSLYAKGKLVDLGCGNAPFYLIYKSLITEVICVDWPNTTHKNQYLDLECDLNEKLPFEDGIFDTIIISEVLEHIANPELIWSEMSRILRSGGKLILSVPFFYKIHEAPHDYYRYTEFALQRFASINKLRTIVLESFGGLPEIITDTTAKHATKIPVVGGIISRLIQSFCRFFLRTGFGKKISRRSSKAYPLGYFMIVEK